ncbi:hypothetical protein [Roseivivax isoporae]|uniref:PepSY domain-containing protein n=1 Tax=Roseivivax isoporae LMG 25204 TaxID=1449351 RepID=X7F3A2_9RHOB|nr:hypothetical protein [Roseivivax isoporae]ETX27295.1 hypothetical protein RISW2_14945 [Roseivivax isoporae LMG 25204]
MTRSALAALLAALCPVPASAQQDASRPETGRADIVRIMDVLAGIRCEIAPDDIEPTRSGYALHDVLCPDGRYEIVLDDSLQITDRRRQ